MRAVVGGVGMLLAVLVWLVAGCEQTPTGPETLSIDGTWSGALRSGTVTVTIQETDGILVGVGNINVPPKSATVVSVVGMRTKVAVSMTFSISGYQPMNWTGTVVSKSGLSGTVNGSGFDNEVLVFTRK